MSALEDRYQVDLDEAEFAAATTVDDLERMLHEASAPGVSRVESETPANSDARPQATTPGHIYPRWAQRWPITWIRSLVYYLLAWPAVMIMSKPRVVGRENARGIRGPMLIVCNHVTQVDIGYVQAALPLR